MQAWLRLPQGGMTMDFKLTEEQTQLRKQFFDVCEELAKKRPEGFTGLEGCFDTDEGWQYHQWCAKEFAKRNWLTLGWPKEYGGPGDDNGQGLPVRGYRIQ